MNRFLFLSNQNISRFFSGAPAGSDVSEVYDYTFFLQACLALPAIAATNWIAAGLLPEIGYLHLGVALIPVLQSLQGERKRELTDLIIAINTASLGIVSFLHENMNGVIAAVIHFACYCGLVSEKEVLNLPSIDLFNIGMCFFVHFSWLAVGGKGSIS